MRNLTNAALIRGGKVVDLPAPVSSRPGTASSSDDSADGGNFATPPSAVGRSDRAGFLESLDRMNALIESWPAPRLPEEVIDAYAVQYRMAPKAGQTFVEYLITKGVYGEHPDGAFGTAFRKGVTR